MSPVSVCVPVQLHDIERQIATESSRVDIETKARLYQRIEGCMPVYDVSELAQMPFVDPDLQQADREDITRAVRYLDLRGLLVRADPQRPHLVSFAEGIDA